MFVGLVVSAVLHAWLLWPRPAGERSRPPAALPSAEVVRLAEPLTLPVGQRVIIRLDRALTGECIFLWGTFRHCTPAEDGIWVAGFGEARNVGPGEAVSLMEFLSTSSD